MGPSKRQTSISRRNALWKTPAPRRALLWILLLIITCVLPGPQRIPSTWMTAYNAALSIGLVGWLAAAAVWSFSRPQHPDMIGLLWVNFAVMIAYAMFPLAPHTWTFWAALPWHHGVFWETEIGTLLGAAGFFGLLGMGITWLWRHFLPDTAP